MVVAQFIKKTVGLTYIRPTSLAFLILAATALNPCAGYARSGHPSESPDFNTLLRQELKSCGQAFKAWSSRVVSGIQAPFNFYDRVAQNPEDYHWLRRFPYTLGSLTSRLGNKLRVDPTFKQIEAQDLKWVRQAIKKPDLELPPDVLERLKSDGLLGQLQHLQGLHWVRRWKVALQSYLRLNPLPIPQDRNPRSWSRFWRGAAAIIHIPANLLNWFISPLPNTIRHTLRTPAEILDRFKGPNPGSWWRAPLNGARAVADGASKWLLGHDREYWSIVKKVKKSAKDGLPWQSNLSAREQKYIRDHQLERQLEIYQSYTTQLGPISRGFRAAWRGLRKTISNWAPKLAAYTVLLSALPYQGWVSADEFSYQYYNSNQSMSRVMVITDTSLFSHTAILVDGLVYNFGEQSLTGLSLREYLITLETSQTPHTIIFTEVFLSDQQVESLKQGHEDFLWQDYKNTTFFVDCTTMSTNELRDASGLEVPKVLNAFPTLSFVWLRLSQLRGNPMIGDSYFLTSEKNSSGASRFWNQVYLSLEQMVETKLMYSFAPYVFLEQDDILTDPDHQFESKEFYKEAVERAYQQAKTSGMLHSVERSIRIYHLKKKNLGESATREEIEILKNRKTEIEGLIRQLFRDSLSGIESALNDNPTSTQVLHYRSTRDALIRLEAELIQSLE